MRANALHLTIGEVEEDEVGFKVIRTQVSVKAAAEDKIKPPKGLDP